MIKIMTCLYCKILWLSCNTNPKTFFLSEFAPCVSTDNRIFLNEEHETKNTITYWKTNNIISVIRLITKLGCVLCEKPLKSEFLQKKKKNKKITRQTSSFIDEFGFQIPVFDKNSWCYKRISEWNNTEYIANLMIYIETGPALLFCSVPSLELIYS